MSVQLYHGDCLELSSTLEENSVDTVITDPPYGLSKEPDIAEVMRAWLEDKPYTHTGGGFMGKSWDSFVPGPRYWREVYRVLKPGGTLLCFASTRTFDLMGIAIRFAGFEMHPFLGWIFGSGFPKASSVSKHLDRVAGVEREVVGPNPCARPNSDGKQHNDYGRQEHAPNITAPVTSAAQLWDGWYYGKQALKPAIEPILMAQKPMDGTGFNNALTWGVAGLWVDGCRVGTQDNLSGGQYSGTVRADANCYGQHKNLAPGEYVQPAGRWPANLILSHNPDCRRVGVRRVGNSKHRAANQRPRQGFRHGMQGESIIEGTSNAPDNYGLETVDAWECSEGCAVALLDAQSGVLQSGKAPASGFVRHSYKHRNAYAPFAGNTEEPTVLYGDKGTAARFFIHCDRGEDDVRFWYCGKSSRKERNLGLEGMPVVIRQYVKNRVCKKCGHQQVSGSPCRCVDPEWEIVTKPRMAQNTCPCVKPLSLMRYLVRLTRTPTGGVVLDPFMGSGSTGVACVLEGRSFIGIEKDAEAFDIAQRRIAHAQNEMIQIELELP